MQTQSKTVEYSLDISEFNWNIAPERTITAWGFNKQVPGPAIKARKGDILVIRVKNDLKEATMIHWHGLRIPASMDGTGLVQKPIQPGEEFEYRFVAPDAGTFWYHSHANETVQLEKGMYGAFIVEDDTHPVVDEDRIFMIDDMKLTADNKFKTQGFIGKWKERHDGRQGKQRL